MNFTPNVTYFCGTEQVLDVKPFYFNSNRERQNADD